MITRGHFIGSIIDSWADLKGQAAMRAKLNLQDANVVAEDYFCEVINMICGSNLVNANSSTSNYPGIDLIDHSAEEAWQITVQKTSAKVNHTLEQVKDTAHADYDIFVLVIGSKQGSYEGVDDELYSPVNSVNFDPEEDIWDLDDLAKKVVALDANTLESVHDYVQSESRRVRIELEVANAEGEYPTSLEDFLEVNPEPKFCGVGDFLDSLAEETPEFKTYEEATEKRIEEDLRAFAKGLGKLPRITREFYVFLLESIEEEEWGDLGVNFDVVKRRARRYDDIRGEISILDSCGFVIAPDEEDRRFEPYGNLMLRVCEWGEHDSLVVELLTFFEKEELGLRKPIVHLDFSDLGGGGSEE